jgi:peptidoglycan hydrolase-like protein with peptidoglycan-binding domain
MSRQTSFVALIAALTLGLLAPTAAQAAPTSERSSARAATCSRTLAQYPVVHRGDRSNAVRTLQCVLNDDGYGPVVVDGFYGPQTRAAVTRVEDGFEGPSAHPGRINNGFWVLLLSRNLPEGSLRQGQHGAGVTTLQRALRAAGGTIVVDGSFGAQTKGVVKAYQRAQDLPATGIVGERTRFFLTMGAVIGAQN